MFSAREAAPGLHLIGAEHAPGLQRQLARTRIRQALCELAAAVMQVTLPRVAVGAAPGAPPRLLIDGGASPIGISISHDGDYSLAALYQHGRVGVDLLRVSAIPDWQAVARDYLGPAATGALAHQPDAALPLAFAQAWSAREASLKCLGLPLAEWTTLPEPTTVIALIAPSGYAASAALA